MKKLNFIALVIIGLYACLNFSSCSKDEEVEISPFLESNATGYYIEPNGSSVDIYLSDSYACQLWINEYSVLYVSEKEWYIKDYQLYGNKAYFEISDDKIEELVDECVSFWDNPVMQNVKNQYKELLIKTIDNKRGPYHYIAKWKDGIVLFNRTSSVNY